MAMLGSLQMAVTYGYIHTGDQRLKNSKSLQSPNVYLDPMSIASLWASPISQFSIFIEVLKTIG